MPQRPPESEFVLPVVENTKDPSEWVTENARPLIYEILGRTARTGLEHGVSIWADDTRPGRFYATRIEEGLDTSIQTPDPPVGAPLQFTIHSHPFPSNMALSVADWESVAGFLLQYPPAVVDDWESGTMRGFVIVGQRLGGDERNNAAVKVVYAKPPADSLSISESRDLSQSLISTARESDPITMGRDERVLNEYSEYLGSEMVSISLPRDAERLHFRSAIPDNIPDREFGNAFAGGDLVSVLEGVTYG